MTGRRREEVRGGDMMGRLGEEDPLVGGVGSIITERKTYG